MSNREYIRGILPEVEIPYRDELDLLPNSTFGMEIEFANALRKNVEIYYSDQYEGWNTIDESTIDNDADHRGELISPILRNNVNSWNEIKHVLEDLREFGAKTNEKCGAHIHLGCQMMPCDLEAYIYLTKLWVIFEKEIYQFSFGDMDHLRSSAKYYAMFLTSNMSKVEYRKDIKELASYLKKGRKEYNEEELFEMYSGYLKKSIPKKYCGLSYFYVNSPNLEKYNTIEFRTLNGTLNEITWQNTINFFAHLLGYFSTEYDKEYIDFYYDMVRNHDINLSKYDFDKALELCGLIFSKGEDILYFMRQYYNEPKLTRKRIYGTI